jgi:hypothetical protein
MGEACGTPGEMKNPYRIVDGKSEGNKPLGRTRSGWDGRRVWTIHLAKDRFQWRAFVNTVMNLLLP